MSRPLIAFWASLASGVLFLGSITLVLRSGRGPLAVAFGLAAAIGLAMSLLVLGRLIYKSRPSA